MRLWRKMSVNNQICLKYLIFRQFWTSQIQVFRKVLTLKLICLRGYLSLPALTEQIQLNLLGVYVSEHQDKSILITSSTIDKCQYQKRSLVFLDYQDWRTMKKTKDFYSARPRQGDTCLWLPSLKKLCRVF